MKVELSLGYDHENVNSVMTDATLKSSYWLLLKPLFQESNTSFIILPGFDRRQSVTIKQANLQYLLTADEAFDLPKQD